MTHATTAPNNTATEPHRTPKPNPRALPKATPAPIVSSSPGTKSRVDKQKSRAKTTTPARAAAVIKRGAMC